MQAMASGTWCQGVCQSTIKTLKGYVTLSVETLNGASKTRKVLFSDMAYRFSAVLLH